MVELARALEDLAGGHLLEGAQRQVHQVMDDLAAERRVEPAAGVAGDVAAQAAQAPLEHEQGDHAERQDVEGLQRVVVDHLVVDGHQAAVCARESTVFAGAAPADATRLPP